MQFTEAVVRAVADRRAELRTAGRLRPTLTPMVTPAALAPWQQRMERRPHTTIYFGTANGIARIIKGYHDDYVRDRHPELLGLLARGLTLADDRAISDTTQLCLPEAIALNTADDEVLAAFPHLASGIDTQLDELRRDPHALGVLALAGAQGLRALHHAGYVHHDVAIANLMLQHEKQPASACWIDFDVLAFAGEDPLYGALWERRVLVGTPRYLPSGWWVGDDDARPSPRTDLVSFGYVLADLAFEWTIPADAMVYTVIEAREAMRSGAVLRTRWRNKNLSGLERVIVTLTDEQTPYDTDMLCRDLDLILRGEGAKLRGMAVHRAAWHRRIKLGKGFEDRVLERVRRRRSLRSLPQA